MLDAIRRELFRYDDWWIAPADLDVLAENVAEAISKGPEYSISESGHWPECWHYASHHACAVAEVERLQAALDEWREIAGKSIAENFWLLNGISRLLEKREGARRDNGK